jgi:hypothetical protein
MTSEVGQQLGRRTPAIGFAFAGIELVAAYPNILPSIFPSNHILDGIHATSLLAVVGFVLVMYWGTGGKPQPKSGILDYVLAGSSFSAVIGGGLVFLLQIFLPLSSHFLSGF